MIRSGQSRDRTGDTRIFSPVLYQLSYLSSSLHNKENGPTVNGRGEAMYRVSSKKMGYLRFAFLGPLCAAAALQLACAASALAGVTPESPEVQKLVNAGLAFLEQPTGESNANKLGGKCLTALAFLKAGKADHAAITRAVEACDATIKSDPSDNTLDIYSNGLAVIFLCELSPQKYGKQIEWYLNRLKHVQKDHGGWGYFGVPSGDTSQTQYGTLSYWEANRRGFNVDGDSVDNLATWLLRTQDPGGCWGYQGNLAPNDTPVAQNETNCSMLAAGLGSMYICADLFGLHPKASTEKTDSPLPGALRPVTETVQGGEAKHFRPVHANPSQDFSSHSTCPGVDG